MSNYFRKVLVTGGGGQVASALREYTLRDGSLHEPPQGERLIYSVHPEGARSAVSKGQFRFLSHSELDITNSTAITQAITQHQPDLIINTAAYTAVDRAESDINAAMQANQLGAKNLAQACTAANIPLLHLSTDYVFDGTQTTAYTEADPTNPINVYGQSKWLGEQAIREHCEQHLILRVSGVFSEYGNNFLKTMLRLAQEKTELRVVDDQITCPTYAGDIANCIFQLLQQPLQYGTFHFCSSQPVSWYAFAEFIVQQIAKQLPVTVKNIHAIPSSDYPTPAKRPAFAVLNCEKICKVYNIKQPDWRDGVLKSIRVIPAQAGIYFDGSPPARG